jgi:hypothetical protein
MIAECGCVVSGTPLRVTTPCPDHWLLDYRVRHTRCKIDHYTHLTTDQRIERLWEHTEEQIAKTSNPTEQWLINDLAESMVDMINGSDDNGSDDDGSSDDGSSMLVSCACTGNDSMSSVKPFVISDGEGKMGVYFGTFMPHTYQELQNATIPADVKLVQGGTVTTLETAKRDRTIVCFSPATMYRMRQIAENKVVKAEEKAARDAEEKAHQASCERLSTMINKGKGPAKAKAKTKTRKGWTKLDLSTTD